MTLPLLIRRSLRQHALATVVTAISIALAGGLLMAVWSLKQQARATFEQMDGGWDAVLGARSSKLQLELNAIFHLEASPGNITTADVQLIAQNPAVLHVAPIAMGDNYRGFRIVGTSTNLFTEHEYLPGQKLRLTPAGRLFDDGYREAVLGSFAARKLGLKVGAEFKPYHGLNYDANAQHEEVYVVTGILEPSNTPADKVIWIPIAGLQNMAGHDPATATDVSAVLVKLRSPAAGRQLDQMFNKQGNRLTFAWPIGAVMSQLFDKIGWFDQVLTLVSALVALVAAGSVLASIYNSMAARRRDLAILRALGARRTTIFGAIVGEAVAIVALGLGLAFGLYFFILTTTALILREQTGVVIDPWQFNAVWLWAPAALLGLGAVAGSVPAWVAYRMDVAASLSPDS